MKRLVILILCCAVQCVYAEAISWQQTTIPMTQAGPAGLETLLVWPTDGGKHPLILINHGSPRNAAERKTMTAMTYMPIAVEFARRGFAAAVVMRRGYGHSGGSWAEDFGSCRATNYVRAAQASSTDLHVIIQYLSTLPQVDANEIIAIGHSAGGFATLALSADEPPKGLVAAIIFAAGRGSTANDTICDEDALIDEFAQMGKTSRLPMLWIYANNDHFFNPTLAKKFLAVFNAGGGKAQLDIIDDYGTEGHYLFSSKGMPVWMPIVDSYLSQQHLTLRTDLLPYPDIAAVAPAELFKNGKKAFATFLHSPPHRAFAFASDGAYGWSSGRYSAQDAKTEAMATCDQYTEDECKIYFVDNRLQ